MLSNVKKAAFQAHTQWANEAPTRILFVRHGETAWNVERRIQGWRGTGLNALGLRQAALVAKRIAGLDLRLDLVLSSDLKRALQTAEKIGKALKLPLQREHGLRERNFGDWEGQRVDDVLKRFKLGPKARKDPFLSMDPRGGESMAVFARRMRRFMAGVLKAHAGKHVVAVTHGGPVRIAACLAAGVKPSRYFVLGRPGNVSLTLLAHQGGVWWVEYYNDMSHLEDRRKPRRSIGKGGRA